MRPRTRLLDPQIVSIVLKTQVGALTFAPSTKMGVLLSWADRIKETPSTVYLASLGRYSLNRASSSSTSYSKRSP